MTSGSGNKLDPHLTTYLLDSIDQGSTYLAEYIWIGNEGELRSKTRTITTGVVKSPSELPIWNFDGSSTGQASGENSEIILKPQRIFKDPFRKGDNILVLCDCYNTDMKPHKHNTRYPTNEIMKKAKDEDPWFGLEQEYTLFTMDRHPFGWPKGGYPGPQGPYYCSVGAENAHGRAVVEAHYRACLYAGISISGINAEVMPGQWEFQVGPCRGIDAGDQLWMSRYILHRVGEMFGLRISFDPKPVEGDWNGAGCHTNFSTKSMRSEGGYDKILEAIKRLSAKHKEHIAVYGNGNERRLTGKHETADINTFKYGVGDRGASIRIPTQVEKDKKGYFEDRRPASNCDPYLVIGKLVETVCLPHL